MAGHAFPYGVAPQENAPVDLPFYLPARGPIQGKSGGFFVEGKRNQEGVVGPTDDMESPQTRLELTRYSYFAVPLWTPYFETVKNRIGESK
jgi:hypothetical protein